MYKYLYTLSSNDLLLLSKAFNIVPDQPKHKLIETLVNKYNTKQTAFMNSGISKDLEYILNNACNELPEVQQDVCMTTSGYILEKIIEQNYKLKMNSEISSFKYVKEIFQPFNVMYVALLFDNSEFNHSFIVYYKNSNCINIYQAYVNKHKFKMIACLSITKFYSLLEQLELGLGSKLIYDDMSQPGKPNKIYVSIYDIMNN